MERQTKSALNSQIYEEAVEWFVESRSGAMDDDRRRELDRWIRKSPEQLSAYLEIAAIWSDGQSLAGPGSYPEDELIQAARLDAGNVVSFHDFSSERSQHEHSAEASVTDADDVTVKVYGDEANSRQSIGGLPIDSGTRSSRSSIGRLYLRAACVAMFGTAVVSGGFWYWDFLKAPIVATGVGEQRSLELEDGSTVSLNSRSKIRIRYSEKRRDIQLIEGQALFHVAKDGARPFVVDVNGTKVRAVGTEFDVYHKRAGTVVTVVEGRVAVLADGAAEPTHKAAPVSSASAVDPKTVAPGLLFPPSAAGASGNILLAAGEQLSVTKQRVVKVDNANVSNATAWTHRELVFDFATLTDVADEFNRYNRKPLVITEPGLDNFHITGMFSSTDPAAIIRFLNSRPGLQVVETPTAIRIERKSS